MVAALDEGQRHLRAAIVGFCPPPMMYDRLQVGKLLA